MLIHFWKWNFLSSFINFIVLNIFQKCSWYILVAILFFSLQFLKTQHEFYLIQLTPYLEWKIHSRHIFLCIPIGVWSSEPELTFNYLLLLFVFISILWFFILKILLNNGSSRNYRLSSLFFFIIIFVLSTLYSFFVSPIDTAKPCCLQRHCNTLFKLSIRSTPFVYHLLSRGNTYFELAAYPFFVSISVCFYDTLYWTTG